MRKVKVVAVVVLAGLMIAGCGSKDTAPDKAQNGQEESVANPWRDCSAEEATAACPRLFAPPQGAEDVHWSIMESVKDEEKNLGALIQLNFRLDDMDFCARAQYGADENADIHGMYYDWSSTSSVTLANWGEGNMQGTCRRATDDQGAADLITWYDIEIGIAYSLSVSAPDLDGFDIQAIAEQMYSADNEPDVGE